MNTSIKTSEKNNDNDNKMSTRTIKINFQGASRDVELSAPFTLGGLQKAIASTFEIDLPARSGPDEPNEDTNLSFTYKDPEGDDIVFDQDSELSLALRLCPNSLEITAAGKEKVRENVEKTEIGMRLIPFSRKT